MNIIVLLTLVLIYVKIRMGIVLKVMKLQVILDIPKPGESPNQMDAVMIVIKGFGRFLEIHVGGEHNVLA